MSVKLKAPKGSGGASFGGEEYPANEKGIVEVPGEAVGELEAHGFEIAGDEELDPEESDPEESDPEESDEEKAKRLKNEHLAELAAAVKNAKAELKKDPTSEQKKANLDAAVAALTEAKKTA